MKVLNLTEIEKVSGAGFIRNFSRLGGTAIGGTAGLTVGATAGALAGGTIGSIVPVAGTAVGATFGASVGGAAGLVIGGTLGAYSGDTTGAAVEGGISGFKDGFIRS